MHLFKMHTIRKPSNKYDTPMKIALIYIIVGGLWILLSDRAVAALFHDPATVIWVSTLKGWFYVIATGIMLYALIRRDVMSIKQSEGNFHAIFDHAPASMFGYDSKGVILEANSSCEKMTGLSKTQLIGHSMFDTFAKEESRKQIVETIARTFAGETIENIEWEYRRADGATIYVLANSTPVYDDRGKVAMGLCLNLDITERKIDEQRQRELELHKRDFYRRTIMAATEGKLVITDKSEITNLAGPPLKSWEICKGEDLSIIRNEAAQIAEEQGMHDMRLFDFILGIGEATTNAYKHAGGGEGSIHKTPNALIFVVSDRGPGMEALVLPELALVKGYTTADSLGMGYKALIAISDHVFLATDPDGTTVAFEMMLSPQPKAAKPASIPDTWVT